MILSPEWKLYISLIDSVQSQITKQLQHIFLLHFTSSIKKNKQYDVRIIYAHKIATQKNTCVIKSCL